ncbi:MAG: hypothetical protein IPL22_05735 [Bacteroidetes bacterium]|nr:hypothetical protein [Bacteroidota bacterium]
MKILFLCLLLVCSNSVLKANYWTQKADFGGTPRADATGFSIGNKGYIGTGYVGTYATDWWEYDLATNTWTQKANFGGSGIVESASFTIGSKGYILAAPSTSDFWEFDPVANTWTQKSSLSRYGTAGCSGFFN